MRDAVIAANQKIKLPCQKKKKSASQKSFRLFVDFWALKISKAEKYLPKALALSLETGSWEHIRESYKAMAVLDSIKGNYKSALQHFKQYIAYRDSLLNEDNTKKSIKVQMQYDFDKKESLQKAEQEKINLKNEEEKRQQKIIMFSVVSCLLLVVLVAIFIFRSLRINKKKNKIISAQKELVEKQKLVVEMKQKEVLDSIHYALRIQRALITNESYFDKKLKSLKVK